MHQGDGEAASDYTAYIHELAKACTGLKLIIHEIMKPNAQRDARECARNQDG